MKFSNTTASRLLKEIEMVPAGSLLRKTNLTKIAQKPCKYSICGVFLWYMLYKKYQRITYSEGVIRASFQIFNKVRSNFPEMLARQVVQPMDILFQNDLKVKFITVKSCKMNQGFKLLFLLKKGRISKKGTLPIFARVTIDGKRIEWSLQKTCEPSKWNQDKGRANGTKTETLQFNSFLNTIQGAILEVQNEYALRKEQLDISVFRSRFIDKNEKQIQTLLQIYQDHNDQFEKLTVTQYS